MSEDQKNTRKELEAPKTDHWEAWFDSNFLRWFHLNNYPALVEVVKITREELTLKGGKKNKRPVIRLKLINGKIKDMKPLVMNITNMESIAKIAGTSKVTEFIGTQVVLYHTTTRMYSDAKKKLVDKDCIRIRAPKEKKESKGKDSESKTSE